MEINSLPILTFTISDKEHDKYTKLGINELQFDRIKLQFEFITQFDNNKKIVVPIKKGQKIKEIVDIIRQILIEKLPISESDIELFDNHILTDIASQITDNLDKIHKTYFEEQTELNPFVADAVKVLNDNKNRKVTKEDIKFIFDTIKKEAPEDELAIRQIIYGMKSTFTNLKIPTEVNSRREGSGKSFLQDLCMSYEDEKYIRNYADISEKALYHQTGIPVIEDPVTKKLTDVTPILNDLYAQLNEIDQAIEFEKEKPLSQKGDNNTETRDKQKIRELETNRRKSKNEIEDLEGRVEKLIDLNYTLINVSDTPNDNIFHRLMSILSQDTSKDQVFMYTDKDNKGHQKSRNIRLRNTPGFIYSQVIMNTKDPRFLEKNRRFVKVVPNTTEKKVSTATDQAWDSYGITEDEYDEDIVSRTDKHKVKELMTLIDAKLIVHSTQFGHKKTGLRIPFTRTLKIAAHSKKQTWQMTVQERAAKYLSVITKMNMDSRPKLVNRQTGQNYIFSTFEDLQEMYYLMQHGALGVRPYLTEWYNKVFLPIYKKDGHKKKWKNDPDNAAKKLEEDAEGLYVNDLVEDTAKLVKF